MKNKQRSRSYSDDDDNVPLTMVKTNGHTKNRYSSDTSFRHSDDDIPLTMVKMNRHIEDPNSYDSLCQRSIEACEFCDRISENRYTSLIHNMTHIIIPLLNQTVYQCHICLYYFTSQEDLRSHKLEKHLNFNTIPQVHLVKNKRIDFFQTLSHTLASKNSIDIKQNNSVQISEEDVSRRGIPEDGLHENKFNSPQRKNSIRSKQQEQCNVPRNNLSNVPEFNNSVEIIDLDEYDLDASNSKSTAAVNNDNSMESTNKRKVDSIKNRLIFEDDILTSSDRLLNDLTTDCKVNLELFNPPWLDTQFGGNSVHFDELIKPGVYKCKKCSKRFACRYDAIIHESSHLIIRNSQITQCGICKHYIIDNGNSLKLHYLNNHKENLSQKHRQIQTSNYKTDIALPKIVFEEEINEEFEDKKVFSKTLKLCDLCYSFCKNKPPMINYVFVRTANKLGKRYRCQQCRSKFFEINYVKREFRRKIYSNKKKKQNNMSNENRLKVIQNRFKMMKN